MSAQTMIDDRTAGIVRSALSAAQAGRMDEACEIGKRGLADGCDAPTLNAMVGAFLCSTGDFEPALAHLKAASRARPTDPLIARNLATAMTACERYEGVGSVLHEDVVATDSSGALLRLRGFAAQMTGDFPVAIADFERLLAIHPDDWETWNNLGNAKLDSGDSAGAVGAFRRAAAVNPRAAPTRLNLARALRDSGDLDGAEDELRRMATDFPSDANPWADLYLILRARGRDDEEVEEAIIRASQIDPTNMDLRLEVGAQQRRTLDFAKAEETYRQILKAEPANGRAFVGLANVLEHYRPSDLEDLAIQAEKAGVEPDRLNLIKAFAARRTKNYEEGLAALSTVPTSLESSTRWHLAGQMYDAVGRYDEAFAAFGDMNRANAEGETEPLRRAAEIRDDLRAQLIGTTAEWRDSWRAPPLIAEHPAPVFLAGFPRSGTTLLDTMLMGHPNVQVMEEPPILRQLEVEFGSFDALADLDETKVSEAQQRYFELAANHVSLRQGSLLVDKSPLYLQRVPQILRLFPNARFILALRHPADALLSCFISNFRLNSSMSNFLQPDTAAQFYDLTFSLWERARELFGMPVHTLVYERMIESPEASLRPLIEGLGLKWHSGIIQHEQTARKRGVIPTASYAQVTEPLYRKAVGRWQHYRKHLEPVLPVLAPWVEKFGYEL